MAKHRGNWPDWWDWELVLLGHVQDRMIERGFSEVGLRAMLGRSTGYRRSAAAGRWIIETSHRNRRWEVIVEPDEDD